MSKRGFESVGDDHLWRERLDEYRDEEQVNEEREAREGNGNATGMDGLIGAVRELVLSTSTHYEGGPVRTTSTLGHTVFSSVIKSHKPDGGVEEGKPVNGRPVSRAELTEKNGPMLVDEETAGLLLNGYINHVSTRYPVVHTPRLRRIHSRSTNGEALDVWEESILHLCYANAGKILESVCLNHLFL